MTRRTFVSFDPVPAQFAPESKSWGESDTTLWAGIASFRDFRCGQTLFNMFSKAEHPERITAGVVQQNEEGDEGCLSSYCRLMDEKVRLGLGFCTGRRSLLCRACIVLVLSLVLLDW